MSSSQVEAVRLALELSSRDPGLVDQLLSGTDGDNAQYGDDAYGRGAWLSLRRGMAVALRESLANPAALDDVEEAAAGVWLDVGGESETLLCRAAFAM
jgi:hypothetical protein